DVPWNPARLEQRIGRVARLGQTAEIVDVLNLWYPQSVEAKIYERVLQRRDVMELALGAFPELVGTAIRNAVMGRTDGGVDSDVIEALTNARAKLEVEALSALWSSYSVGGAVVGSGQLRREVAQVLEEISTYRLTQMSVDGVASWKTPP